MSSGPSRRHAPEEVADSRRCCHVQRCAPHRDHTIRFMPCKDQQTWLVFSLLPPKRHVFMFSFILASDARQLQRTRLHVARDCGRARRCEHFSRSFALFLGLRAGLAGSARQRVADGRENSLADAGTEVLRVNEPPAPGRAGTETLRETRPSHCRPRRASGGGLLLPRSSRHMPSCCNVSASAIRRGDAVISISCLQMDVSWRYHLPCLRALRNIRNLWVCSRTELLAREWALRVPCCVLRVLVRRWLPSLAAVK